MRMAVVGEKALAVMGIEAFCHCWWPFLLAVTPIRHNSYQKYPDFSHLKELNTGIHLFKFHVIFLSAYKFEKPPPIIIRLPVWEQAPTTTHKPRRFLFHRKRKPLTNSLCTNCLNLIKLCLARLSCFTIVFERSFLVRHFTSAPLSRCCCITVLSTHHGPQTFGPTPPRLATLSPQRENG